MSATFLNEPLPATMHALVCESLDRPFSLKSIPTPDVTPGSIVVKVLACAVQSNLKEMFSGQGPFKFPTPIVPGTRAVGRVAITGPDTTSLSVGQLVMLDPFITARDNPDLQIIWGTFGGPCPASQKLMADNWRNAAFAEYTRVPLENCFPLNEKTLCGDLGLTFSELTHLGSSIVAYGGLRGIDLRAGENIIVAPASGIYSGATVQVADAMGANVITVSRNLEVLKKLQTTFPRIKIVPLKGDYEEDLAALSKFGLIEAYADISPHGATGSTHVRSCLMALKEYGRAALMGVIAADIAIPYVTAVFKNLTIRGSYMYKKEDVRGLIRLAESGVLKCGKAGGVEVIGEFKLEELDQACEAAAANTNAGQIVTLVP
ncbi:putative isopropanol dehydrogenase [Phaeomoniella chlamydospora]|uniref:Putative isopropanol dehydrogenase n=1 Tax=Phaeomoniella chlamydospora TaxID=158046 RepID=A0A0G2ES65_PHACM|nr:putative isopropanol dehydrogenase [Phaeomoniella chlamydospora]